MGLSIYKGPIPPRNVGMVFHQVLYQRKLESDQGRMVFGEYKEGTTKLQIIYPKRKKVRMVLENT